MKNKNEYWLDYAFEVSKLSKDKSTKVGAVIVNPAKDELISFGYNGFVRGFNPLPEQEERPEKYFWAEHAERNAIYNHLQDIVSHCFCVTTYLPSMEEVRALVSCGVKNIYVAGENIHNDEAYPYLEKIIELCDKTNTSLVTIFQDNSVPTMCITNLNNEALNEKTVRKSRDYISLLKNMNKEKSCLLISKDTFAIKSQGIEMEIVEQKLPPIKDSLFKIAKRDLEGYHIYSNFCPCSICTLAIAAVGFSKVITFKLNLNNDADRRWQENFMESKKTLNGMGIEFLEMECKT